MAFSKGRHYCLVFTLFVVSVLLMLKFHHSESKHKSETTTGTTPSVQVQQATRKSEESLKRLLKSSILEFKVKSIALSENSVFGDLIEPENITHFPKCTNRTVDYYPTPHPMVALASYPGSGNSWIRYLIEQMSGIYTGSRSCDRGANTSNFKVDCAHEKNYTIVVDTQLTVASKIQRFDRAVLILRNFYNTLCTQYNKADQGTRKPVPPAKLEGCVQKATVAAAGWHQHAIAWFTYFRGPIHILSYERLENDFFREMYSLAKFLNINVTYHDLWCVKEKSKFWFRQGNVPKDAFDAEQKTFIDVFISDVKEVVKGKYDVELPF